MKLFLLAGGPLGILAAGVATTLAAIPQAADSSSAILIGFGGLGLSIMGLAVPLVWKISKMQNVMGNADRDFRRAIFGGESEPGLVAQVKGLEHSVYGPAEKQEEGMQMRLRDLQSVQAEWERRLGEVERTPTRGEQSG